MSAPVATTSPQNSCPITSPAGHRGPELQVGAADAAGRHLQHELTRAGRRIGDLGRPRAGGRRSARLHAWVEPTRMRRLCAARCRRAARRAVGSPACPGSPSSSAASTSAKGRAGTTIGSGSPTSTSTPSPASATTANGSSSSSSTTSRAGWAGCPTVGCSWSPWSRGASSGWSRTARRRATPICRAVATGRCNDMVVAADGTAYVGNFGFELGTAPRAHDARARRSRRRR